MHIRSVFKNFLTANQLADPFSKDHRIVLTINAIIFSGVAILSFFILYHLSIENHQRAWLNFFGVTMAIGIALLLRISKNIDLTTRLTMVVLAIYLLSLVLSTNSHHSEIMTTFVYPVVAFMLRGRHKGLQCTVIFYAILFPIAWSGIDVWGQGHWSMTSFYTFIGTTLLISIISFVNASSYSYAFELLSKAYEEAEQKIQAQHAKISHQKRLASMGEMVTNITHQWRQPINVLALILQKLQIKHNRQIMTESDFNDGMAKGLMLIENMSSTIDDFKNFTDPNKHKEYFTLPDVITYACTIAEAKLEQCRVNCDRDIRTEHCVYGVKNELSQVIFNLLHNAIDTLDATKPANPHVSIRAYEHDDTTFITVTDNGGGIRQDVIEKIFDPYFTTKGLLGTGLGLYMSKMIIEVGMEGRLDVHNTVNGACFTITLKNHPSALVHSA